VLSLSPIGTELTYKHVSQMHYTMAACQESLRLYPPINGAVREVSDSFEVGGYRLKKGDKIVFHYPSIHKENFTDPEQFIPERWREDPKYKDDDKKGFCTFAGGGRLCIGMKFALIEMQTLLAVLVKNNITWKLEPRQDLSVVQDGLSVKVASGLIVRMSQNESTDAHDHLFDSQWAKGGEEGPSSSAAVQPLSTSTPEMM